MKKHVLGIIIAGMALWIYAQSEAPRGGKNISLEERRLLVQQKTGGLVRHVTGEKIFLVLNFQKKVSHEVINEMAKNISQAMMFSCDVEQVDATDVRKAIHSQLAKSNVGVVLAITDSPDEDGLIIAPENRWAIVNTRRLEEGSPEKVKLDERFRKEIWRAIGYLMGSNNQASQSCLLQANKGGKELDLINSIAIDSNIFANIMAVSKAWNLKIATPSTYRKACEEGWAPMPTNNFQKAIWEEVKAKKAPEKTK